MPLNFTASEWKKLLDDGQIVDSSEHGTNTRSIKTGILPFTVDLKGSGEDGEIIGYRSKKYVKRIDLERRDYDPLDFWESVRCRYCCCTGIEM